MELEFLKSQVLIFGVSMLKAFMVVGIVLFAARWAVPHILHEVVRTRSRELFVITIILLCIGTAFLTSKLGLSLALGAFLAGIVISESEYASQAISDILPMLKRLEQMKRGKEKESYPAKKSGHVIIIGFGINGSNLARVLKESGISYVVLEMNANTVKKMKKKGEPIYYGDGTSPEILHKMGIHRASVLVVAISDPAATRRIVQIARHENPDIHIIVRTRYVAEVDDLIKLGANEVLPEEFETSIEIFSRVLHHYHVPKNVITEHIDNIRQNSYSVLRTVELPKKHLAERYEFLKDIKTETYLIKKGSHISRHSIKELHLRAETGVTIIAVQRGEEVHQNPSPDFVFKSGDVLLLIGKRKDINC